MSDISLLLQHGWNNIWKDKTLWLFSALILITPLVRLAIPTQKSIDFPSSLFNLIESFVSLLLLSTSTISVSYVTYCIATENPINILTVFQTIKRIFWRFIALILLLSLFFIPYIRLLFIFTAKYSSQISDFSHISVLALMPLYTLGAVWYFLLTEIIANDSGIGKSIKNVWAAFTYNFTVLATIGIILAVIFYAVYILIAIAVMLTQNSFDFTSLIKLDFISPWLSFPNNNLYTLATTIAQIMLVAYTTSVFTLAYLKYGGVKASNYNVS